MLIDEVEFGLEPHRLRHLLRKLRPEVNANQQVFLTTHSRVSIEELNSDELHIVHNTEGIVDIKCAGGDLQNLMRKAPEAFLSTKVLACEGLTEVGFVRHLDNAWQSKDNGTAFAYIGVVPTTSEKGGGKDMPAVALAFKRLGFEVAYLCDSDDELSPSADDLRASGITVVQWEGGLCIEQRIAQDMPFEGGLDDFVAAAVENKAEDGMDASGIYDSISSELNVESGKFTGKVSVLKEMGKSEEEIRKAIGERANKGKWFKRISAAERLCAVVLKHESAIENSDLIKKINMVKEWVYA